MSTAHSYFVEGQMVPLRWVTERCPNVSRVTIRARLLAGLSTLAELNAPRGGAGYGIGKGSVPALPNVVINEWKRRARPNGEPRARL